MNQCKCLPLICLFLTGCAISPVPQQIVYMHQKAHENKERIQHLLRPGDIIFRQGEVKVAGGIINFSKLIAELSSSDFSHTAIVYQVIDGEAIVTDVSVLGLQRFYLIDWLLDSQQNIVVKRLKPQYRHYIPALLSEVRKMIEDDPLYDENFKTDDRYYCTEAVDHCFRQIGLPLAQKVPINQLPGFHDMRIFATFGAIIGNIDLNTPVVVAGNEQIGLFSSPYLETVIDLR